MYSNFLLWKSLENKVKQVASLHTSCFPSNQNVESVNGIQRLQKNKANTPEDPASHLDRALVACARIFRNMQLRPKTLDVLQVSFANSVKVCPNLVVSVQRCKHMDKLWKDCIPPANRHSWCLGNADYKACNLPRHSCCCTLQTTSPHVQHHSAMIKASETETHI